MLGGASTGTVTCTKGCVFGGEKCTAPCNPITDVGCSGKRCQRAGSYFPGERLRCVDPSAAGALCSKGLPCGPGLTYRGVGDFVCVPWCTSDADCMGSLCSFAAGIEGFGVCVSYPCP